MRRNLTSAGFLRTFSPYKTMSLRASRICSFWRPASTALLRRASMASCTALCPSAPPRRRTRRGPVLAPGAKHEHVCDLVCAQAHALASQGLPARLQAPPRPGSKRQATPRKRRACASGTEYDAPTGIPRRGAAGERNGATDIGRPKAPAAAGHSAAMPATSARARLPCMEAGKSSGRVRKWRL